jgi:hypothetical protein
MKYSPYSPNLSPCDYYSFGPLKIVFGVQRFTSNEEAEEYLCNWLLTKPESFYKKDIKKIAGEVAKMRRLRGWLSRKIIIF